jgi:hypothetical protein
MSFANHKFPMALWMNNPDVKCKGNTIVFYPNKPSAEVSKAKAICNGLDGKEPCKYQEMCLKYAIDNGEAFGVWGGTSERDRRRIQQARRRNINTLIYNVEDISFAGLINIQRKTVVFIQRKVNEDL